MLFSNGLVPQIITDHELVGGPAMAVYCVGFLLCMLIPYLLGSLNFAIIISKVFYHDDIRKHGSGNAGATNMLRTYGTKVGIITFVCDLLKTVVAVIFGSITLGYFLGGASVAGFFCILGHVFPIFSKFHGGKGVSAAAAVVIMTNLNSLGGLLLIGILILMFVVVVAGTKYVSLGSVIAVSFYPLLQSQLNAWIVVDGKPSYLAFKVLFAFLTALVVVVRHIGNLKRIREGTESKLSFKKH